MNLARSTSLCAVSLLCAAASTNAFAGRDVLLDGAFDNVTDSNFTSTGQFWHAIDFNDPIGFLNIPLDFGDGVITGRKFLFNASNGQITFVNSINAPTGDSVKPLNVPNGYNPAYGNGTWTFGELAPGFATTDRPVGPFVYDPATTLKAYRFTWKFLCRADDGACSFDQALNFQAVFIALDPEDFILEFNYQNSYSPAGGFGNFVIGGNSLPPYTGPFTDTGPNYCFHAGVASVCGSAVTPSVPEPGSLALLAGGALTWIGLARRRRTKGAATA